MEEANESMTIGQRHTALIPYLLICASPVILGLSGVLVRWAELPGREYLFVFWRSVFTLGFYAVGILVARNTGLFRPGSRPALLAVSGLATAAYTICAFKAYNLIAIGPATFIIYLAPVFVAVFAPLVLKEKLERSTLLCLAIALTGTGLLCWGQIGGTSQARMGGALLALAAAVFGAVLILLWKKLRVTHSPLTIGLWTNGVCAVAFAPFAIPHTGVITPKGWAAISVFGVVIGAAGFIYLYALKRVKAQDAGLLSYIEPVSATFLGFVFLGEVLNWQEFAGAALIIAAGVLLLLLRVSMST